MLGWQAMGRWAVGWRAAACLGWATLAVLPAQASADDTRRLVQQVLASADHGQRPFAVVDKRRALVSVFHADGALAAQSATLLGSAQGDHSLPGVGQRTQQAALRRADRTTPAGRFSAQPGHNLSGEAVVWLDHAAALAIHRLRSGPQHTDRAARMAGQDAQRRRVSAGCVVVPAAFFDSAVQPLLGLQRGTVYVLPEHGGHLALPDRAPQPDSTS